MFQINVSHILLTLKEAPLQKLGIKRVRYFIILPLYSPMKNTWEISLTIKGPNDMFKRSPYMKKFAALVLILIVKNLKCLKRLYGRKPREIFP